MASLQSAMVFCLAAPTRSYVTIVCAWLPCSGTLNIKSYLFANFTFECTGSGGDGSSDVSAPIGATAEAKNYSHRHGTHTLSPASNPRRWQKWQRNA